jgi:uncharacterized membrane protein
VISETASRLEAFSDGVFAIAITLLILEIRVPVLGGAPTNRGLLAALGELWPSMVAFVLSFFVILVMWINHHELLRFVRAVDYPLLFANGFLLLVVTFVPFPTAVLAQHLATPAANTAVAVYCGTFVLVSLAWNALLTAVSYRRRLLRSDIPAAVIARVRRAYGVAPLVYAASVVVAWWSAAGGLVICASLWLVWTRLCYRADRTLGLARGAAPTA